MKSFQILIPVYNDWNSLLILLDKINKLEINKICNLNVLIVDDASTENLNQKITFLSFNSIEIIKNKKNIGHGKSIAYGIKYLTNKKNFDYLIVMDGDGEDRPEEVKELILKSLKTNKTVTANRIKRSERILFRFLYQCHIVLTYIITGRLIRFGNYMCMPNNQAKLLANNINTNVSFSGTVEKFIKNKDSIPSIRGLRYKQPTKMSLLKLIRHSLLIISIFKIEATFRILAILFLINFIITKFAPQLFVFIFFPLFIISAMLILSLFYLYQKNIT